jgi:hypothetical protein
MEAFSGRAAAVATRLTESGQAAFHGSATFGRDERYRCAIEPIIEALNARIATFEWWSVGAEVLGYFAVLYLHGVGVCPTTEGRSASCP